MVPTKTKVLGPSFVALLILLLFLTWLIFMSWDAARTQFTAVPWSLQLLGALFSLAYMLGCWWVFCHNTFAAPVVKIQEQHRVIGSGPYAVVRHPMYAFGLLFSPVSPCSSAPGGA